MAGVGPRKRDGSGEPSSAAGNSWGDSFNPHHGPVSIASSPFHHPAPELPSAAGPWRWS